MCYDTAQLAFRIYKEAIRMNASDEEVEHLRKKWKKLDEKYSENYHVSGYNHPQLITFIKEDGKVEMSEKTWGLIPQWVKDEEQAKEIWNKTINARGESIFEKPSFRDSAKSKRCIIPVDGFYEYYHKNNKAFPYYIHAKNHERLLIGGLYSDWVNPSTGEIIETFNIVTSPANALLKHIHNNPKLKESRMPLILNEEDVSTWLEGKQEDVKKLIHANQDIDLESHTVRKLKGKEAVGNTKEAMEEFEYSELTEPPTLFE